MTNSLVAATRAYNLIGKYVDLGIKWQTIYYFTRIGEDTLEAMILMYTYYRPGQKLSKKNEVKALEEVELFCQRRKTWRQSCNAYKGELKL